MDDKVPLKKDTQQDEPFVLIPNQHFDSTKLKAEQDEVTAKKALSAIPAMEIWPQLLTKALSKAFLNYERMLTQNLGHYLRHLSGMPVKEYQIEKVEFSLLRHCYKKQH